MGSRNMKDSELESLFKMIQFFLSKKEDYWENHPEEVYSIYTELQLIIDNAG